MLSLCVRVDQGVRAIALALLEPHHPIVWCHIRGYSLGEIYTSAEKKSVYFTVPADLARRTSGEVLFSHCDFN